MFPVRTVGLPVSTLMGVFIDSTQRHATFLKTSVGMFVHTLVDIFVGQLFLRLLSLSLSLSIYPSLPSSLTVMVFS